MWNNCFHDNWYKYKCRLTAMRSFGEDASGNDIRSYWCVCTGVAEHRNRKDKGTKGEVSLKKHTQV